MNILCSKNITSIMICSFMIITYLKEWNNLNQSIVQCRNKKPRSSENLLTFTDKFARFTALFPNRKLREHCVSPEMILTI